MAASETSGSGILDAAIEALSARLPSSWAVEKKATAEDADIADLVIKTPKNEAVLLVETKADVAPRDVEALVGGPWRRWRPRMGDQPILLVAPYIGPRARELLIEENVSFLDLTGNARISLDFPGMYIETQGANQDPRSTKPRARLRGAKAGAVVRVLVDAAPPYTGAEIARAANVNEGYLSRILDTLVGEGLVDRERSGPVIRVDWPGLLRRRSQTLDLFRRTGTYRFIARQGAVAVLARLRSQGASDRPLPTVTGSFAAPRLAPIAAPTLLAVYATNPLELASELELLPAEAGADTVLIRPDNDVVFARARQDGRIAWAAPSQVAIDCLAGTGRMPSEGEAVIDWMQENEDRWRYPSIGPLLADVTGVGT